MILSICVDIRVCDCVVGCLSLLALQCTDVVCDVSELASLILDKQLEVMD